ncbi:MAG: ribonuclease P protein component [Acidobacteriota bacterium]|jgi:ribonuclease P protein component
MPIARNSHRLAKHADYQRVYRSGRRQFGKQITYFYLLRSGDRPAVGTGPRIGLTVPKALGKAVDRNRIKRRMRAAIRSALPRLTAAVDVVLHPRRSVIDLEFVQLRREVAALFAGVQARCGHAAHSGQPDAPTDSRQPARRLTAASPHPAGSAGSVATGS